MSWPLEYVTLDCPVCGEPFEVEIDLSAGSQSLIEDCRVCCAPAQLHITIDAEGNLATIETAPANG